MLIQEVGARHRVPYHVPDARAGSQALVEYVQKVIGCE